MTTTSISDLGREAQNRGCNFGAIWDACESPVFLVLDEDGNNVAEGKIRHFQGRYWLYVDDTDGYSVMHEDAARRLILTPEE